MKISTTLVTLVITLLGVLPFFWFMYIGKNATLKHKKMLAGIIESENLTLNQKEQWNNNLIGIDETKKVLLFLKLATSENQITKIDLHDIKSCRINKITRDFKKDKKIESELQMLNLDLTFASRKPDVTLNFYDIKDNFSEEFEMKRVEKWETLIKKHTNKTAMNVSAA